MYYPTNHQYQNLKKSSKIIPVICEVNSDMETPISLFQKFRTEHYCYLFESVEGGERWARYSFMGRKPLMIFKAANGKTSLVIENRETIYEENPVNILKKLLEEYKNVAFKDFPWFHSGFAGYFAYDFVRYCEDIPSCNDDELNMPDCHLFVPEELVVYDHLKQKVYLIVNTISNKAEDQYNSAIKKLQLIASELFEKGKETKISIRQQTDGEFKLEYSVTKQEFCNSVKKAKEYIHNGDIFQVVLSQRFKTTFTGDPLNVYRILRTSNPSPYMYFLHYGNYCITGASPEMLVRLENSIIETCPIAGTRPRGKNDEEDKMLEKELKNDEKEKAEHIMLVDLGRNDIGKVSRFGTVKVQNLMHIEKYSHVMHLVTNVSGCIQENCSAVDVLTAMLPAGTVSGAPKVRAMEIIEELEALKRGVYAGAIGYIGFDGNLDTCIAIRTAIFKDSKAYIQAGAGIVADSIPEKEYEETLNKAQTLIYAVKKAGEVK